MDLEPSAYDQLLAHELDTASYLTVTRGIAEQMVAEERAYIRRVMAMEIGANVERLVVAIETLRAEVARLQKTI